MSGAVRYRVAKEPSKAGFLAGHDLLMAHGQPWQLPLWEVEIRTAYHGIRAASVSRRVFSVTATGSLRRPQCQQGLKLHRSACSTSMVRPCALRQAPYEGGALLFLSLERPRIVIETPSGELGSTAINMNTVVPVEGLVTPFVTRPLVKSTKHPEEKLISWAPRVLAPVAQLPKTLFRASHLSEIRRSAFTAMFLLKKRCRAKILHRNRNPIPPVHRYADIPHSEVCHTPPPRRPQSDGAPWHSPLVSLVGDAAQRAAETKAAFVPQDINSSSPAQKPDEAQRS
ncbi:hypothetical protein R3P38DRAFT_3564365 [Favolaschia claudopus]|uniref:Uncharacterized protein n=1 Tax=Favolaschia claudopus TaxID=2862362 RepID=A0AAW0DX08_9AGAR